MTLTTGRTGVTALALTGVVLWLAFAAAAVETEIGPSNRPPPGAIVVDAGKSIEWDRPARVIVARGDASARRDDQELHADVLTAHYREKPDGSIEVWRIDAKGKVRFVSPSRNAFGEQATYDVDKQVMTMSGGEQVGVTTATSRITAQEELEYHTKTRTLIARGGAVAVEGDRTLYGELIVMHLRERVEDGQSPLQRLEAERNVRVVTPEEDIRADSGAYNVDTGEATLAGSVRIVKGTNRLDGCRAEMNLRTGVSRMIACPGQPDGRVRGMILPETRSKQ